VVAIGASVASTTLHAQDGSDSGSQRSVEEPIELPPIVVTSRKREERLQEAPVSVTVSTEEDLGTGKRDRASDIIRASPNATFVSQGSLAAPQISIRGIGGLGAIGGLDHQEGVGFFLDEVFIARPTGYPTFLYDADQTEVVRGSQAVLYGKNTIGGAINVHTRTPGDTFSADVEGSLGTNAFRRAQAGVDTPIVPGKLGARTFLSYTKRDGFIDNSFDGDELGDLENLSSRLTVVASPGADTDVSLSLDYSRDRGQGFVFGPVDDALDWRVNFDQEPDEERDIAGVSAKLTHQFDTLKVSSITAFRGYDYNVFLDGDFTPQPLFSQGEEQRQRQFTQELRLSSAGGEWVDWMVGGFYMWEDFQGVQLFDLASVSKDLASRNSLDQTSNTYSVFGETTLHATDRLDLTAGLRYTRETKDGVAKVESPSGTFLFGAPAQVESDETFDNISPEFTVSYYPTDEALLYAKVSRGFKGGGMTQFIVNGQPNTYEPEKTWTYEVGTKTAWLRNRLTLDASAFYIDWTDQQVLQLVDPGIGRNVTNAGESTSYGVEIEAAAQVTPHLQLSAGYGFLNAEFDSFVDPVTGEDFSGNKVPFAPQHSATASARYRTPLIYGFDLSAGVDYSYRSSYFFLANNEFSQKPTHLVDLRLGVERGPFSASVWAKNLLDEAYLAGYFQSSGQDLGSPALGRTVGVNLALRF
jgi:iron complex outermembrane receptor protein